MDDLRPFRVGLEETWRDRLEQASHRYRSAQREAAKTLADAGSVPHPDGQFAASRAFQAASTAFAEYRRVLKIFNDLVIDGKVPPDA